MKSLRGIHFDEVVPVEQLLERLARDKDIPSISLPLSQLLLNSYFPQSEDLPSLSSEEASELRRTRGLVMIQQNVVAAEAFYSNLPLLVPLGSCTKFASMLICLLNNNLVGYVADEYLTSRKKNTNIVKEVARAKRPRSKEVSFAIVNSIPTFIS